MVASDVRAVLEERAGVLARPLPSPAAGGEAVVVLRRRATYAIPAIAITAVRPLRSLEPLPGMPPFVAGLVAARGEVFVAIDLALLFGSAPPEPARQFAVVAADGLDVAVLADEVVGVRIVDRASLERPPSGLSELGQAAGLGLEDGVGLVLEPGRLLGGAIGMLSGRVVER